MSTQPLPGFRDFYPAEFAFRAHIFERWREVARRYGFEEYDGPPLEPLELYTAKSGDEIVGQLYNFKDKGDRDVSLRPEMTPTVARMVAARAGGMKKPIRWFSIAQFFRYERQQKGRLREFYQLNCDIMGESGPLADAELIALSIDLMRSFGLTAQHFRVRLSDRAVLDWLLQGIGLTNPDQRAAAYAVFDKLSRMRPEQVEEIRSGRDPRLPGTLGSRLLELGDLKEWSDVRAALDKVSGAQGAKDYFDDVVSNIKAMSLGEFIEVDIRIVRGLAYYTGTVFELFDVGRNLRAIAGGGRYDGLLEQVGKVDMPAVGFAIGDVVLGELLKEAGLAPQVASSIDVFVAAVTQEDVPHVLSAAHMLRDAGVRVEYSLRPESVGKQLKLADSREAALAVVIGPDDRARGEVQLKELRNKAQHAVKVEDLVGAVQRLMAHSS